MSDEVTELMMEDMVKAQKMVGAGGKGKVKGKKAKSMVEGKEEVMHEEKGRKKKKKKKKKDASSKTSSPASVSSARSKGASSSKGTSPASTASAKSSRSVTFMGKEEMLKFRT